MDLLLLKPKLLHTQAFFIISIDYKFKTVRKYD